MAAGGIGALVFSLPKRPEPPLPDGKGLDTPQEKKAAFISYLVPYVREINTHLLADRQRLLSIRKDVASGGEPWFINARWLKKMAADYECEQPARIDVAFLDEMLIRVDIVSPSLVVAQAAEESGWGTSRFARRGNNLFGKRAYNGKGLTPQEREPGEKFKVAAYPSVRDSIADYMHTLNVSENYLDLRKIRRELRRKGQPVSGVALAAGLAGYSGRAADYVETIIAIIQGNKLGRFDS